MVQARHQSEKRGRMLGAALSLVGHMAILLWLLWSPTEPQVSIDPATVVVTLVEGPRPSPAAKPPAPARSLPAKSLARNDRMAPKAAPTRPPSRVPTDVEPVPAHVTEVAEAGTDLSEAQIAGAATAGSGSGSDGGGGGGGGGVCDMAGRVQAALRKDPLVRAAVAGAAGKAAMVWNGDWVKSQGEDGKGLAAVREAIMWEVAFAPAACRAQPVRGLVVLSLNQAAGSTRLAVGTGQWRWSDLLTPRRAYSGEAGSP